MNVLSLFDGMSCCRLALEKLDVSVEKYYASEIDKYAIEVTQANYPDTKQLGDVTAWQTWELDWASIDLVTGGFPCQAWSLAGKQLGDKDERGKLFWTMLDVMAKVMEHNPKAFYLMENVKMKKEFEQYITHHTEQALPNVYKYLINSALVSAQSRQRYYWTNIPGVEQPEDKGVVLRDVLEEDPGDSFNLAPAKVDRVLNQARGKGFFYNEDSPKIGTVIAGYHKEPTDGSYIVSGAAFRGRAYDKCGKRMDRDGDSVANKTKQMLELRQDRKSNAITTVYKDSVVVSEIREKSKTVRSGGRDSYDRHEWDSVDELHWRKLTPLECERLQTVPDNYTNHVSNTQRYKMLGKGWTVDVIAHILNNMEKI